MVKGEFTVVEYLGWQNTTYSEIVSNERLRVKSTEPSLTNRSVIKTSVKLPEEVAAWYDSLPSDRHAEIHKEFQDAIKADVVDYAKGSGELKILSRDELTPKKVELVKVRSGSRVPGDPFVHARPCFSRTCTSGACPSGPCYTSEPRRLPDTW